MTDSTQPGFTSFPGGGIAVIAGESGAIGGAFADMAEACGRFRAVVRLSRRGTIPLDILDERSVASAARAVAAMNGDLRLFLDATGFLHDDRFMPEKSLRDITPEHMAHAFAVNATGPALLMKHFLPLLPREGKSVLATLSAKVGSIGDNRLGGWFSYRASKAALNQLLHTAAIETARRKPEAVCLSVHPGTVASALSAPFEKTGLHVRPAEEAASDIASVVDRLTSADSGGFFDHKGEAIAW